MLYGSQGFSSYGYQAGCDFATGTAAQALADPNGARYLCPGPDNSRLICLNDHSGGGVCVAPRSNDGFPRIVAVRFPPPDAQAPPPDTLHPVSKYTHANGQSYVVHPMHAHRLFTQCAPCMRSRAPACLPSMAC